MYPLLLFDVDGTIAESGQPISDEMRDILSQLSDTYDIGIVGGGTYEKIRYQLGDLEVNFLFSECGSVYHRGTTLITKQSLRSHPERKNIDVLIKVALGFLSTVPYLITGHYIDLRNGLVYISLIGMQATQEERAEFISLDNQNNYRHTLLQILQRKAKELGSRVEIVEGGSVGIAVYPVEWNKAQVLQYLPHTIIHYFGDKYGPGGNDYPLLHHPRVIGHPVQSVEQTLTFLQTCLNTHLTQMR